MPNEHNTVEHSWLRYQHDRSISTEEELQKNLVKNLIQYNLIKSVLIFIILKCFRL